MADLICSWVMARMGLSFDCLKSLQDDMPDSHEKAHKTVPVCEVAHGEVLFWHV